MPFIEPPPSSRLGGVTSAVFTTPAPSQPATSIARSSLRLFSAATLGLSKPPPARTATHGSPASSSLMAVSFTVVSSISTVGNESMPSSRPSNPISFTTPRYLASVFPSGSWGPAPARR